MAVSPRERKGSIAVEYVVLAALVALWAGLRLELPERVAAQLGASRPPVVWQGETPGENPFSPRSTPSPDQGVASR